MWIGWRHPPAPAAAASERDLCAVCAAIRAGRQASSLARQAFPSLLLRRIGPFAAARRLGGRSPHFPLPCSTSHLLAAHSPYIPSPPPTTILCTHQGEGYPPPACLPTAHSQLHIIGARCPRLTVFDFSAASAATLCCSSTAATAAANGHNCMFKAQPCKLDKRELN